ncbi:MAG: acyltransferase family protein [bacterium]|nr:acyltransferase family protein [bacterium]
MKNKKTIMFVSSLLIIIFHLWVNVSKVNSAFFNIELFIRTICYIGVDIFFFLTAYSLSKNEIKDYKKFIISRFIKIYLLYILFTLIAFFYKNWSITDLILSITGLQLFMKGGGAFLWFVPAIMIVYILLPLYNKCCNKKYLVWIIWLIITIIVSKFTNYKEIFILTNRIPIILIGSYLSRNKVLDKINIKQYIVITILLLIIGFLLLYNYNNLKCDYIYDIKYLIALPFTLGLILILDLIPSNKLVNLISSSTLEMYMIQMLFGYDIANELYFRLPIPILYNIIIIIIIIGISVLLHYIYGKIMNSKKLKVLFS